MDYILRLLIVICLFSTIACKSPVRVNDNIEVVNQFSELQERISADQDQVWVINFWATSCPPCLKEMPHFHELEKKHEGKNVKVLLVSLDEPEKLDTRVIPFVAKHKIIPEVIILGDDNYSAWTGEIDKSWYGALPATVIIRGSNRKFRFGAYDTYQELKSDLDSILD